MAWSDAARAAALEARRRHTGSTVSIYVPAGKNSSFSMASGLRIGRRAFSKIQKGLHSLGYKKGAAFNKAAHQIAYQSRTGTTSVTTRAIKAHGGWKGRV